MTDKSTKPAFDDVDMAAAICKSLPPGVASKALFCAVTSLAMTSNGEIPPPPKSTPVEVIVGLLGAMGVGVAVATIPGDADAEEAKQVLDEALAKAAKK
jgi:hypothetical protein